MPPLDGASPLELFWTVMDRGGLLMWPLALLSVTSLALVIERATFWILLHRRGGAGRIARLAAALRSGDRPAVEKLLRGDGTIYGRVAARLLDDGASDAVAIEAVEAQRPRIDRFMGTLSTIITAAPMVGILGTVTGIIRSFQLIGEQSALTDPRMVSGGIAEALITTAAGLLIAILTLFPFMIFRAQGERSLGRLEVIIAAAQEGHAARKRA
ncbi:MAG TPA: MotA/TolQ/ExbB proton channel family protein [Phycisphaerales bacterium]|nr:MotA/TolQ/ExbB proton channel family protein [Phycisphaerales bacterium]HMP37734.1 MotA/TolQ/ExbB proton channel family protein [Phycisphaerales bacterium]